MTVTAAETVRGLHIGGQWTEASGGKSFDDHDPFTGEVVAAVPAGTREDAKRAIDAAAQAFPAGPSRHPQSVSASS